VDPAENIPGFTKTDRLGLTAFVSVLVHMTVILGVSFSLPDLSPNEPQPTLDITLVNTRSDEAPDEADFLAQANQEGGGDSDEAVVASSPPPVETSTAAPQQVPVAALETDNRRQQRVDRPLTQDREDAGKLAETRPREQRTETTPSNRVGQAESQALDRERAKLTAEISQFWQEYQKRPRRKFLSARTREYKYAEYMEHWRARVERVGNLNYPDKARRQGLTGSLVLDVAVKPDGSVHALNMVKSSGIKVLDDAARRIVRLAGPFEKFPADIREEVDILHITRTWQFMRGNRLVSR